jgi:hypothetical protein
MFLQTPASEKLALFRDEVSKAVFQRVEADLKKLDKDIGQVSEDIVDEKQKLVYSEEITDHIIQALAIPTIGELGQLPATESIDDYPEYVESVKKILTEIGAKLKDRFQDQDLTRQDVIVVKSNVGLLMNRYNDVEASLSGMAADLEKLDVEQVISSLQAMQPIPQSVTELTEVMQRVIKEVSSLRKEMDALSDRVDAVESSSTANFSHMSKEIQILDGVLRGFAEKLSIMRDSHPPKMENTESVHTNSGKNDDFDAENYFNSLYDEEPDHENPETDTKLASRGFSSRRRH